MGQVGRWQRGEEGRGVANLGRVVLGGSEGSEGGRKETERMVGVGVGGWKSGGVGGIRGSGASVRRMCRERDGL